MMDFEIFKDLLQHVQKDRYGNLYIEQNEFDGNSNQINNHYYVCLVNAENCDFPMDYCSKRDEGFEFKSNKLITGDTITIKIIKDKGIYR